MVHWLFKRPGWRRLLYCDHQHRSYNNSRVYPFEENIQYADKNQILNCKVESTWDIFDSRYTNCLKGMIFSSYFKNLQKFAAIIL